MPPPRLLAKAKSQPRNQMRWKYGASIPLTTVLTIGCLLGHRDPATTLKYLHLSDAMVREAAEAVGAVLEG